MMRLIRDHVRIETQDMTFEELKAYMQKKLAENTPKLVGKWLRS
jgi:hypothetical protein